MSEESTAHLLRNWTPYASFRCWIDARRYAEENQDDDRGRDYRVRIRQGWYVVERKENNDAED